MEVASELNGLQLSRTLGANDVIQDKNDTVLVWHDDSIGASDAVQESVV